MTSQDQAEAKAAVLIEALPWLKRYAGQTIVVKFGGSAMVDDELTRSFAEDMVYLRYAGVHPVVVHGGGPQITAELTRRGIPTEFRGGLRVTTPESIGVVRQVLNEQVGASIVRMIEAHGDLARGVSGESHGLFTGQRRTTIVDGSSVDLGLTGEVTAVDVTVIRDILESGRIPVVSSLAGGPDGLLNVNADSAAAALAVALGAKKLVILTDVAGLYSDWPDRASLVSTLTIRELTVLLPSLQSGMIPKMTACLTAVSGGVPAAAIIDGRQQHAILLEIFMSSGIGTEVTAQ